MIRFIKGEYLYYESGAVIVMTDGGIGFRINVSDTSSLLTASEGDELSVYTYLQVKEDGMALYGFPDADALGLFEQLITVKGVGPKAGLAIMSLGTPNQIKGIIAAGDAASIAMAQGVGKKTAERVILELKDKIKESSLESAPDTGSLSAAPAAAVALSAQHRISAIARILFLSFMIFASFLFSLAGVFHYGQYSPLPFFRQP